MRDYDHPVIRSATNDSICMSIIRSSSDIRPTRGRLTHQVEQKQCASKLFSTSQKEDMFFGCTISLSKLLSTFVLLLLLHCTLLPQKRFQETSLENTKIKYRWNLDNLRWKRLGPLPHPSLGMCYKYYLPQVFHMNTSIVKWQSSSAKSHSESGQWCTNTIVLEALCLASKVWESFDPVDDVNRVQQQVCKLPVGYKPRLMDASGCGRRGKGIDYQTFHDLLWG